MSIQLQDPARTLPLKLRLPAAILRFWSDKDPASADIAADQLSRRTRSRPGFHHLGPETLAVTAESGDPAIYDTAIHLGLQLVAATGKDRSQLCVLVLPGEILLHDGTAESEANLLAERAPSWFTGLQPGAVHLTGWVLRMLELPRQTHELAVSGTVSDQRLPVFRIGLRLPEFSPWRNAEILNRRIKVIHRLGSMTQGGELLASAAWRIQGPVGCGKSHFAHHLLYAAKAPRLWLRGEPAHRRTGSWASRIVQQLETAAADDGIMPPFPQLDDIGLLETLRDMATGDPAEALPRVLAGIASGVDSTFYLVIDDLEQATPEDLLELEQLIGRRELGGSFRLLLVGRRGLALPSKLQDLTTLEIGPLDEEAMGEFSQQLFAGLSLPQPTQKRLCDATAGCPLALEEGMIALIREQSLRRVYGSFFFAGRESAGFSPSPRFLCHLQGETIRLGIPGPLHLLSVAETSIPAELLQHAADRMAQSVPENWREIAVDSALVTPTDTPWGPGLGFTCRVFATTLEKGIDPDSVQDLRAALGETLATEGRNGRAFWETYRVLRGTPTATYALLQSLDTSYVAQIPRDTLLDELTQELHRHRERDGEPETELRLLWKLLPLARKSARLNEFATDLERAVHLARDQPRRLLALAGLKAEMEQDAGRYSEAESTIRLALEAAKGIDERRQALLLIQLGRLLLDQERYRDAQELFQKLVQNLDRSGLEALSASCRYYLGNIAFHEGRYEEALELHRKALDRRQRQDLKRAAGTSLTALGAIYWALGNYPQALSCYREAQNTLEIHGGDEDRAFPLLGLGRALNSLGDYTSASRPLRQALALREGKDDIAGEAVARLAVAENHLFLGQLDRAQEQTTRALFQLNLLSRKALLADAEQLLGRIRTRSRQFESAQRHLRNALALHREKDNRLATATDLGHLVKLALTERNDDDVARYTLALQEAIAELARPELVEQLHFRMYEALEWLRSRGQSVTVEPLPSLEKAYREVFRKASHLEPELRHHFLFQISEYRDILSAAARAGLTTDLTG